MAIKHLKINGAEVTYREEGAGVPVVLLNGMLGDYRGVPRGLAEGRQRQRS